MTSRPVARLLSVPGAALPRACTIRTMEFSPIPLHVTALSLGPYGTYCYIVSRSGAGEAFVIDPGAEPERIRGSA